MPLDKNTITSLKEIMEDNLPIILESYITTSQSLLEDLKDGFDTMTFKKINEAAHPLKSSSHQIGALSLSACAGKIEHLAAENKSDGLEPLISQCISLHEEAIKDIKSLL